MKRILSIATIDLRNNMKDFMVVYMFLAPILIAIIISLFVPSAESSTVTFIVDQTVDDALTSELEKYATIERYTLINQVNERVLGIDDVVGLTLSRDNCYEIITEGNESAHWSSLLKSILAKYETNLDNPLDSVNVSFTDIGYSESPISIISAISVVILCVAIAGMIIGLNIVQEKESSTIRALNVTPLRKLEFIIGKSIVGCVISLCLIFIVILILGYGHVDLIMLFIFSLINLLIVVLFGFLTGVTSPNQMAAIANIKLLFLPVSISIIGAIFIPSSKQFLLYWSPFYWTYLGYTGILKDTITWLKLGYYAIWIVLITALLILALKKKINKSLN